MLQPENELKLSLEKDCDTGDGDQYWIDLVADNEIYASLAVAKDKAAALRLARKRLERLTRDLAKLEDTK